MNSETPRGQAHDDKMSCGADRLPSPIPEALAELLGERLRVLGQPMRLRLVDRLRDGEATVRELTTELGAVQQNVSQHLGILRQAHIVVRRKRGALVYYELADPHVVSLLETAAESLAHQLEALTAVGL